MSTDAHKSLTVVNAEISKELANPDVSRALLATTFKGLDALNMKKAILEGHLRGFTFKDFLEKNVYAVKFGQGYALVTSIDRARKIGARNGVVGIKKPEYTMDGKTIVSCEVTVQKRSGGYVGDYTAEVFFEEYYKEGKTWDGKYTPSMWDTKPRTMISKVAEMHALRKACPEELSQSYTEEELEKEGVMHEPHEPMPSYTVERIVPAADDDEQSEPIASARVAAEEKPKVSAKKKTKVEEHDEAIENMFEEDK